MMKDVERARVWNTEAVIRWRCHMLGSSANDKWSVHLPAVTWTWVNPPRSFSISFRVEAAR